MVAVRVLRIVLATALLAGGTGPAAVPEGQAGDLARLLLVLEELQRVRDEFGQSIETLRRAAKRPDLHGPFAGLEHRPRPQCAGIGDARGPEADLPPRAMPERPGPVAPVLRLESRPGTRTASIIANCFYTPLIASAR